MKKSSQSVLWALAVVVLSTVVLRYLEHEPEAPVEPVQELTRTVMLLGFSAEEFPGKSKSGSYVTSACDAVLVPLQIPVVSPRIKSILTALSQYDPPPGLHNIMKDQALTVGDVYREPGKTEVDIVGTPGLSGLCDRPQLKAQIEETIALYNDDPLTLTLNGSEEEYECMEDLRGKCG